MFEHCGRRLQILRDVLAAMCNGLDAGGDSDGVGHETASVTSPESARELDGRWIIRLSELSIQGTRSDNCVFRHSERTWLRLFARRIELKCAPVDWFAEDAATVQQVQLGGAQGDVGRFARSDAVVEMPH